MSEEIEYPPIEECVRVIAAQIGAPVNVVADALLSQSKQRGMDAEELVHTQYRTALAKRLEVRMEIAEEIKSLFNAAQEKECKCGTLDGEVHCPHCSAWAKAENRLTEFVVKNR